MTQWPSGTMAQWPSGPVAQWYSGTVAQWPSGTMAQWHSGTMTQLALTPTLSLEGGREREGEVGKDRDDEKNKL